MPNEILLILTVVVFFGMTLLWLALFGERGLVCWTVIATITANIEVLILIDAFGMEQTLGNVMFASTFLVTDMLSELYGKKAAKKAVYAGILTSICFIAVSNMWLLFTPSENDWAFGAVGTIFTAIPRIMIIGLVVYAIVQRLDVWLYHKWWAFTERKTGGIRKFLWLRNNGSTLISQLINSILFTFGAFWGDSNYNMPALISIAASSFLIYTVTSVADTPFIYIARFMKDKNKVNLIDRLK